MFIVSISCKHSIFQKINSNTCQKVISKTDINECRREKENQKVKLLEKNLSLNKQCICVFLVVVVNKELWMVFVPVIDYKN